MATRWLLRRHQYIGCRVATRWQLRRCAVIVFGSASSDRGGQRGLSQTFNNNKPVKVLFRGLSQTLVRVTNEYLLRYDALVVRSADVVTVVSQLPLFVDFIEKCTE